MLKSNFMELGMNFLKLLFSFKGRINRAKFWLIFVIILVTSWVFSAVLLGTVMSPMMENMMESMQKCQHLSEQKEAYDSCMNSNMDAESIKSTGGNLFLIQLPFIILLLWVSFAMYIKRFHDMGKSGWMSLLYLIPFVNLGIFIWQGFFKGTPGDNQYGPDPLVNTRV